MALEALLAGTVLEKNLHLLESYGKGAAPGPGLTQAWVIDDVVLVWHDNRVFVNCMEPDTR